MAVVARTGGEARVAEAEAGGEAAVCGDGAFKTIPACGEGDLLTAEEAVGGSAAPRVEDVVAVAQREVAHGSTLVVIYDAGGEGFCGFGIDGPSLDMAGSKTLSLLEGGVGKLAGLLVLGVVLCHVLFQMLAEGRDAGGDVGSGIDMLGEQCGEFFLEGALEGGARQGQQRIVGLGIGAVGVVVIAAAPVGSGVVECALGHELAHDGVVVGQRLAVGTVEVGIDKEAVQRELHPVLGVDVEELIYDFTFDISEGIYHEGIAAIGGVGVVLAFLHPAVLDGVAWVGIDDVNEKGLQMVARVAAVGVAHDNLGTAAGVDAKDVVGQLSQLRLASGKVAIADLGIHVEDVEIYELAVAEVGEVVAEAFLDEAVGTVVVIAVVVVPGCPVLGIHSHGILAPEEVQTVGVEEGLLGQVVGNGGEAGIDLPAMGAGGIGAANLLHNLVVVVEVLADGDIVVALGDQLLADGGGTCGFLGIGVQVHGVYPGDLDGFGHSIDIHGGHRETLVLRCGGEAQGAEGEECEELLFHHHKDCVLSCFIV